MKIAVIILNWNGKLLLERFLPSVIKYSSDLANIYLADNASTDDSINFVNSNYPEVKVIKNTINGGYARGYQDAIKHVKEPILCLLNNDVEVTENWLNPIINIFDKEAQTAVIQPKILDKKNPKYFEYAGAAGGYIDRLGYPYCRGRIFDFIEMDQNQYDNTPVFWASGACFFIRNKVFHEVGGFDTDYFAHMEEIDLCWRIFNASYDTKYCKEATVYHLGGSTLNHLNPNKTYLNFRNSLFTILKNSPNPTLIILLRLILDGLAAIYLFTKNISDKGHLHFLAVIRAHVHFYVHIPKMIKKRKKILLKRKDYYNKNSILWLYHVKNMKTFKSVS